MAFALRQGEPLGPGITRLVLGQLDSAVHHLAAQESDPTEAVHETRKAMKRTRTMLRLLRRALGTATFSKENAALRDIAGQLSKLRDEHMLVEATARLAKHLEGSPYAEAVTPVHEAFRQRASQPLLSEALLHELLHGLQAVRKRLESRLLDLSPSEIRASLRHGLRQMARRAGRAYTEAFVAPLDDNFHAWRKRVKDLYYTACLLHLTRPQKLAPLVDALDKLADDLGDEHDLGILATVMHENPQTAGGAVPVAMLLQLIARRREELRQALRPQGKSLHAQKAKRLARSMLKGLKGLPRSGQADVQT